jgi:CHAD domain-containing protein/HD superfamily phosphodiesterase
MSEKGEFRTGDSGAPRAPVTAPPEAEMAQEKIGLAHWMGRVLKECDRVGSDLEADPVHDLRVALRRCRSLADGMMVIDPSPAWKQMKKAGKKLFRALGELRDAQVMTEWVEKLAAPDDPVGKLLAAHAAAREKELKQTAVVDLQMFDRKRWSEWSATLPQRLARVRPGSAIFLHMALDRWTEAHELHRQALRNRTQVAFHRLRIGLKRFRYTAENFLPALHKAWIGDLKELQDLLGEVHDLDVLWAMAVRMHAFPDQEARTRWSVKIREERDKRLERYRNKMVGRDSLWGVWRAELPQGKQVKLAAMARLKLWASFLDTDFAHAQRVAKLALQLHDGLAANGLSPRKHGQDLRSILQAAALLHEIGRSKRTKNHHKVGARMVRKLRVPLGWDAKDLQLAGLISRYHRGALPRLEQKEFARLRAAQKNNAKLLAGILRLAEALDGERDGTIGRLRVENNNGYLSVVADGYSSSGPLAERVAKARYLLESVYDRPVMVRGEEKGRVARRVAGVAGKKENRVG